jgi:hypothetical protein
MRIYLAARYSRSAELQAYRAQVEELGGIPFSYKEWCGK